MKKTNILAASVLAVLAINAYAVEPYVGIGTSGYTVGAAYSLTPKSGIRAEVNTFSYNASTVSGSADYDAKLKISSAGTFYDYFPFAGGLRVSAGAFLGDRKLDVTARNNGTVVLDGVSYSAVGESLSGSVKYPSLSPYIGIGYGHNAAIKGFGFHADIGVAYGRPDVSLQASSGLLAVAGADKVEAERRRIQDDVNKYSVYPVLNIGLGYSF